MLYFAYGSNLNLDQMARRTPAAMPVSPYVLKDWKLVFRGVADIVPAEGETVQGGLWDLTPECEAALDRYEGFNAEHPNSGMYRKVYLERGDLPNGETTVMIYVMRSTGIYPPSAGYFDGIKVGYRHFDLPVAPLFTALEASYDDKAPSHIERQRMRRNGRPRLKERPSNASEPAKPAQPVKAARKLSKAERKAIHRANARHSHDPWADTSWGSKKQAGKRAEQRQKSLDEWLAEKYFHGERF